MFINEGLGKIYFSKMMETKILRLRIPVEQIKDTLNKWLKNYLIIEISWHFYHKIRNYWFKRK